MQNTHCCKESSTQIKKNDTNFPSSAVPVLCYSQNDEEKIEFYVQYFAVRNGVGAKKCKQTRVYTGISTK